MVTLPHDPVKPLTDLAACSLSLPATFSCVSVVSDSWNVVGSAEDKPRLVDQLGLDRGGRRSERNLILLLSLVGILGKEAANELVTLLHACPNHQLP